MIGANLFLLKASGKEKLKMAQPSFLISEEKNAKEKWEWVETFRFDFKFYMIWSSIEVQIFLKDNKDVYEISMVVFYQRDDEN